MHASRRRVADRTPKLETKSGVRYVSAAFSHTTVLARLATMSWFIAKNVDPTINAIDIVRFKCCGAMTTETASGQVDHVAVRSFIR